MIRFLAGFALVYLAVAASTPLLDRDSLELGARWWADYLIITVAVPLLSAWIAADIAQRLRRPRLFDARVVEPWRRLLLGVAAGAVAFIGGEVLLALLDRDIHEAALFGASAFAIAAGAIALCRRPKPGRCIRCRYELAGAPTNRCPECGLVASG